MIARCGLAWDKARLGTQGWEGEKSGLFEHPAGVFFSYVTRVGHRSPAVLKWFFLSLRSKTHRSGQVWSCDGVNPLGVSPILWRGQPTE